MFTNDGNGDGLKLRSRAYHAGMSCDPYLLGLYKSRTACVEAIRTNSPVEVESRSGRVTYIDPIKGLAAVEALIRYEESRTSGSARNLARGTR